MNSLELLGDLYIYPQHIRVKMADGSVFDIKQYNELLHQRIPKKEVEEVEEYEAEEDAKIEKERFELTGPDVPEILHVMESLRILQKVDLDEASLKDILLRIRIYPIEFVITDFKLLLTQISQEKPTDTSDIKSTIYFYFLRYAILYEMIHRLDYFIKAKEQIKEIKSLREALYPVLNDVLLKAIGILKVNLRNVTSNPSFYKNISKLLLELIYEEDYVINNVTFRYQIDAAFNLHQGVYYDSFGQDDDDDYFEPEEMLFLAKRRLSRKLVSKQSSKKSQSKKIVKKSTRSPVKKLVKKSTRSPVKKLVKKSTRSPVKKLVKKSSKRSNKHM
jgi:hypothetical protein